MKIKRNLGGERVGVEGKMEVEMHDYQHSYHNLSHAFRSGVSPGTLVPFTTQILLPDSEFNINLISDVHTLPTQGPLFGSFKLQLDMFSCPIRLYNSYLHNNKLNVGLSMSDVSFPTIELTAKNVTSPADLPDISNSQIHPSSILSYLGIRGVGLNTSGSDQTREFNALPILMYWDIYKQYYANKQEELGAVVHCPGPQGGTQINSWEVENPSGLQYTVPEAPATFPRPLEMGSILTLDFGGLSSPDLTQLMGNIQGLGLVPFFLLVGGVYEEAADTIEGTYNYAAFGNRTIINWSFAGNSQPVTVGPNVELFNLDNLDTMRENILAHNSTTPYSINSAGLEPYRFLYEEQGGMPNILCSQEGLALKTYLSDLHNNWLKTEFIESINNLSAISTVGNQFTIDDLLVGEKIYRILNRVAVSGGSYNDWLETVYGLDVNRRAETPMYIGGMSQEITFQEVVSNALSEEQPLGTLGGRGRLTGEPKGGKIKVRTEEPTFIMGILSLTPRIDYSQGNAWYTQLQTMDDLHKPGLDQIGFQDLITEKLAWWDTEWNVAESIWLQKSAGLQPAWIDYMSDVSKTYGNFAIENNQMFMTLNRRYEYDETNGGIKDLTTYIDPSKYNQVFAQASFDAMNFWVQVGVKITAKRKQSAKIMPTL